MSDVSPKVSIIVPVYNTSIEYLKVALDGITKQTYLNTEVILVDDGSNSATAVYLDEYTKQLQDWQVIHQSNTGLSGARNAGYNVATGKYIQFLDSDDIFMPGLIEEAVACAETTDADIVLENFISKDYESNTETVVLSAQNFPGKDSFSLLDIPGSKFQTIPYNVWSKLFKKKFLEDNTLLHDEDLHRSEDVLFTDSALVLAQRISIVINPLIMYRENLPSSNTKTNDKHPAVSALAWEKLYHFLRSRGLYDTLRGDFEVAMTASLFWHFKHLRQNESRRILAKASVDLFKEVNLKTRNDPRNILELMAISPEIVPYFIDNTNKVEDLAEQNKVLNVKLSHANSEIHNLRYPGIRFAIIKLLGAVKRRIKRSAKAL